MATVTAQDAPAITAWDATARLAELAGAAISAGHALYAAGLTLRDQAERCDSPERAARVFAALRALETALHDADRHAGEVISHAVTCHGYY